jgi:hypothetical protein
MKKTLPDDMVIVFIGLFCAMLYMWFNLESIKTQWDFQLFMVTISGMIIIPLCYSMYTVYQEKVKGIIYLLERWFIYG